MSQRKPRKNNKEKDPTFTLRRSPRFLNLNQSNIETPKTPKPAPKKIEGPHSFQTPLTKTLTKCSDFSETRVVNGTEYVIEKRATRSSVLRIELPNHNDNECNVIVPNGDGIRRSARLRSRGNVSKNESSRVKGKRVTGSLDRRSGKKGNVGVEKRVVSSSSRVKKVVLVDKDRDETPSQLVNDGRVVCATEGKMCVGEKRKRCQVQEECRDGKGWSEAQELALQRAYFTAKPTPHFWKKVAKMVPGKSAEECFDKIQSDQLTPSQPRTRSRANMKKPSPLSFSASKLLSPSAETRKPKRPRLTKKNTLLAQKTVRSLLQKQQNEDQHYEPDFFSLLEPTVNPSFPDIEAFASPNEKSTFLTRCRETSSSAHRKQFSRLKSLSISNTAFVSPMVLKQVKNKALHEKYIDQLHCREAKRKAESLRNAKGKNDKKVSDVIVNSVKIAKDALVFDAQDAISQFRSLQSSMIDHIDEFDEDEDHMSGSDDSDELS